MEETNKKWHTITEKMLENIATNESKMFFARNIFFRLIEMGENGEKNSTKKKRTAQFIQKQKDHKRIWILKKYIWWRKDFTIFF